MPRFFHTPSIFAAALLSTSMIVSANNVAFAEEKAGTISISATGKAMAAPDMATISLTVNREAATARDALDANNAAMADVLGAMKEAGIEDKDLQTSSFNIQPIYRHIKNQAPKITGYRVYNNLTVRIRDLENLGAILDRSVTLGVNSGGHINFGHSNSDELTTKAREDAVKRAMQKAKTLTSSAGAELGRIVNISEANHGRPRPMQMERMAVAMDADSAAAVPIAAGESGYNVTVSITWELQE